MASNGEMNSDSIRRLTTVGREYYGSDSWALGFMVSQMEIALGYLDQDRQADFRRTFDKASNEYANRKK